MRGGRGGGNLGRFSGLSYAVSRKHGKFTEAKLLRMEHFFGILFAGGAVHGFFMIWRMAKHEF